MWVELSLGLNIGGLNVKVPNRYVVEIGRNRYTTSLLEEANSQKGNSIEMKHQKDFIVLTVVRTVHVTYLLLQEQTLGGPEAQAAAAGRG